MLYFTHKLLKKEKAEDLANRLMMSTGWIDGYAASGKGTQVKKNLQLNFGGEQYTKLSSEINHEILASLILQSSDSSNASNAIAERTRD